MKRQPAPPLSYLQQLESELEEIRGISGQPCWIYTAYQMHRLFGGISQLESINHLQGEEHEKINTLLDKYHNTLNAITK